MIRLKQEQGREKCLLAAVVVGEEEGVVGEEEVGGVAEVEGDRGISV